MSESILDRIVADVRRRLNETPEMPGLEAAAHAAAETRRERGLRSLRGTISGPGPAVIAECKKASPSAGVIDRITGVSSIPRACRAKNSTSFGANASMSV